MLGPKQQLEQGCEGDREHGGSQACAADRMDREHGWRCAQAECENEQTGAGQSNEMTNEGVIGACGGLAGLLDHRHCGWAQAGEENDLVGEYRHDARSQEGQSWCNAYPYP